MQIFLDASDIKEVRKWLPVISGVTTNPGILEKQGGDLVELAKVINPMPLSIEACGDFVEDAMYWSGMIPNAVIKVPLLAPDGKNNIDIIKSLSDKGVAINCTALFSLSQVILAQKAGARYVSIFYGRIDDEGGDAKGVTKDCADYLMGEWDGEDSCELIVGSIRTIGNVTDAIKAGADIVTVPPPILEKMSKHARSLETVKEFELAHSRISK